MKELKKPMESTAREYKSLIKQWIDLEENRESLGTEEYEKKGKEIGAKVSALREHYDFSFEYFEENGKVGIKDYCGDVIVPALYDAPYATNAPDDNLFPAITYPMIKDGKVGIVSLRNGRELTPFIYDTELVFTPGCYILCKDKRYGLFSEGGEMVLDTVAESYEEDDLLHIFRKDGHYIFVYHLGHNRYVASDICEEYEEDATEDYQRVCREGRWGYLDAEGHFTENEDEAVFSPWL